ncbi:MAG: glycosyltransferase [Cytophagia bacterium]|nr:MAG: glycosyltransferase [Cytophagia bacterium]TAG43413.1 MAG: glycosyltransferase [Cytophagia bacterium]
MEIPLVSVICICYQHEKYLKQALESIFLQTYPRLQILITDDASKDSSVQIIKKFIKEKDLYLATLPDNFEREIFFENDNKNIGNCKRFNQLFKKAKGKYIIDFATDDVFLPEKIEEQVNFFEKQPEKVGVVFTNCINIDEQGNMVSYHFKIDNETQKTIENVPEGNVFGAILRKYFIPTPTMMIKKTVLEQLEGYDENLSYEDFDFWVRSVQICDYRYLDTLTTFKRDVNNSHSKQFYQRNQNQHLASTLLVCKKAATFIQKKSELFALKTCLLYHQQQCFFTHNFDLFFEYETFLEQIYPHKKSFKRKILNYLAKRKIKLFKWYQWYVLWKFKKKI